MLSRYSEVRCDYFEEDTNLYYIDAWRGEDDNEEGKTIATVDEDGVVCWKDNYSIGYEMNKELHSNLWEAIEEAKEKQKERKQELVDRCIEEIKRDVASGDVTAIDELLMFLPTKYLKGYLPEDLS
jgi:predicted transcriptional regulator